MNRYAPGFAPPSLPPERTRKNPTCARCERPIVYVEMEKTGKLMPCDPVQIYGDGRRHLITRVLKGNRLLGRMVPRAPESVLGFEPHWGTCPNRAARKGEASAAPSTSAGCTVHHLVPR